MASVDERLTKLLRGAPPESVAALDESDRASLADLIEDSRRRQTASLEASFEATLKHVPFPVRKIVRKVLLG